MKLWNHYHTPQTTDEAVHFLNQYAGQARIVAGGTDLLVDARAEIDYHPHEALIDITHIPELLNILEDNDTIYIGAGVTHTVDRDTPLPTPLSCTNTYANTNTRVVHEHVPLARARTRACVVI